MKEIMYDSMKKLVDIRGEIIELLKNIDSVIAEIRSIAEEYDGISQINKHNDERP
jgi:hypothetical protein